MTKTRKAAILHVLNRFGTTFSRSGTSGVALAITAIMATAAALDPKLTSGL